MEMCRVLLCLRCVAGTVGGMVLVEVVEGFRDVPIERFGWRFSIRQHWLL
jgi:hypothetical protein